MENFYLIDYIRKSNILSPELLDALKYELDKHIYYYGNHFKYPKETRVVRKARIISKVMNDLFFAIQIFKSGKIDITKKIILSNAYFTINAELRKLNYDVFSPSWCMASDKLVLTTPSIYKKSEEIKKKFSRDSFFELISPRFVKILEDFNNELNNFYTRQKISALFVPNDLSFFENFSIQVCKKLNIPSFVFLHGLPGRYNNIDDNRADYLIVWGEKIKINYVKAGVNANKIFVSGHPYYKSITNRNLKFSLEDILVITKTVSGAPPCSNEIRLSDRGNLLLFLYSIENVLKMLGVKAVRFRPHPSENPEWYLEFINSDFYRLDTSSLQESIQRSSLIIGSNSTVFLESIYYGVNYLIYEPSIDNVDLVNDLLVPPFDGSDSRIPVAKSEEELKYLLINEYRIDPAFFHEYIKTPFDISFVRQLI